jgi:hypothetical protein
MWHPLTRVVTNGVHHHSEISTRLRELSRSLCDFDFPPS